MIYELYTPRRRVVRRITRKKKQRRKEKVVAVDRYVRRIQAGSGSRKFKEWLNSRPMDAYVTHRVNGVRVNGARGSGSMG